LGTPRPIGNVVRRQVSWLVSSIAAAAFPGSPVANGGRSLLTVAGAAPESGASRHYRIPSSSRSSEPAHPKIVGLSAGECQYIVVRADAAAAASHPGEPYSSPRCHGPVIANVTPGVWMLTKSQSP